MGKCMCNQCRREGAFRPHNQLLRLLAVTALLLSFASCAPDPLDDDECAGVQPHFATRPVVVRADEEMSDDCMEATVHGVDFWRRQRATMDFSVVDTFDPVVAGDWVAGTVGVLEGPIQKPIDDDWDGYRALGVTRTSLTLLCDVYSAHVTIEKCSDLVAAHELGHALGLVHHNVLGNLMHERADLAGWDLTAEQADWARDP